MKLGKKEIRRRDIVRMENDQVVFADKVRVDKERVGQVAIGGAVAAVVLAAAAADCKRNSSEEGYLSNAVNATGLVAVGAIGAIGIVGLEGMRTHRHKRFQDRLDYYDQQLSAEDPDPIPTVDLGKMPEGLDLNHVPDGVNLA